MLKFAFPFIEVSRVVHAPREAVWDLITDTGRWVEWGPSVRAVECTERYIRKGSKGRVKTTVGLWLPFVVTDFEDGVRWSWRVSGLRATGHRIEKLHGDRCRIIFQVPISAALYVTICKIAVNRIARLLET